MEPTAAVPPEACAPVEGGGGQRDAEPRVTPNLRIATHQTSHAHRPVAMAQLNQTP
jgi:hypothetical protein